MDLLQRLSGGDRRSIGAANEVAADVLADLSLLGAVFEGMLGEDAVVRMRAADVVEKVSAVHPECLAPFKTQLLGPVAAIGQQEVRWHVAQMLPRLELDAAERAAAVKVLVGYLEDKSVIAKTFAMQALAEFATVDDRFRPQVVAILQGEAETGSPAMKSRGRKLLKGLGA